MMLKSKIQILPNPKQILNPKSKLNHWDFEIGIYLVVLVVFVVLGFISHAYAQPVYSTELINNAKEYDGKLIAYQGEVIGDVMARNEYAWINVNDGDNAIGIWIEKNLIQDIVYTGGYKSTGDTVEITGTFHRACPEHGGDLDIHAKMLKKINPGRLNSDKLNTSKRNFALVLLGILVLVWILSRLKSR